MPQVALHYILVTQYTQTPEFLRERWNTGELADIRAQIVAALRKDECLDTKSEDTVNATLGLLKWIDVTYSGMGVQLSDLRGIDLQGLSLKNHDFSHCCFDYADLNHCAFNSTQLQFSSFCNADLSHSVFFQAQASPVCMVGADLRYATIENSFFMHSDFKNACLEKISLCEANLDRSYISHAEYGKT